jgi:drug/metabolite transporter (DMT)-like permease
LALSGLAGTLAAGIPSILFLRGIRTIGGTRTGILMLFEPVVGVVLAAVLLREGLTPIQLAGGACILAAAVLVQRSADGRIVATAIERQPGLQIQTEPATIEARERT